MKIRTLALVSCWMLPACSNEPLATDKTGKYAISGSCQPGQLAATLQRHADATLVVDFGPGTQDLGEIAKAAGRTTPPFTVVVGPKPEEGQDIADAVIVAETGAPAAVDFALLACNGVDLQPNRIEVGTRTFTAANRAAGGQPRVAPGDVLLAMMRMQHAAALTRDPKEDVVHSVGLITCDPNASWQGAAATAAVAAAKLYPQVQLLRASPNGDATKTLPQQAAHLIKQGARVLVVTTSDPADTLAIQGAAANGPDGAVPIIVIDPAVQAEHGTCVIGCSSETVGNAVAAAVNELLPNGGSMVACSGSASADLMQGFCEAMGFDSDRLLRR
jgi:hypothetical protein